VTQAFVPVKEFAERMTLRITDKVADRIRAHAAETYPHECCGALLGREEDGAREVLDLLPLANRREDSPRNRYSVPAEDVRAAERAARQRGLDLIGWYHSHPDHPARPSEYDREHAWPWYSYVILSVMRGAPGEMTAWRLADDRARFHSEPIEELVPGAAAQD
jgi:proteasome lid subunit RPN8/RPN11